MTTASAAIASSNLFGKKTWKNGHLEAGLRSGKLFEPFPEEISRRIADRFSDLLFAPSKNSAINTKNLKGKTYITGNTIVDSVNMCVSIAKKNKILI